LDWFSTEILTNGKYLIKNKKYQINKSFIQKKKKKKKEKRKKKKD